MQIDTRHRRSWTHAMMGLIATSSAFATTVALADERAFDKRFTVTAGGTLNLDTDTGGVTVTGSDSTEVVIHAQIRGGRGPVDKFVITAEPTKDGVEVRGRRNAQGSLGWPDLFGGGLQLTYTIQVPRNYHVEVRTAGGNVELKNLNGKAYGRTSGGNVTVTSINGDVQIQTSGGNVRGTQLIGDVRLGTSGGDITIDTVRGPLEVRTSGGNVHLMSIDGKVLAKSSGGNVTAELVGSNQGVDLHTSGGDVIVVVPKQFAANVQARTSGGDVTCDLPVVEENIDRKHHRSLNGTLNGGGNPLTLHTSGGDIRIRTRS